MPIEQQIQIRRTAIADAMQVELAKWELDTRPLNVKQNDVIDAWREAFAAKPTDSQAFIRKQLAEANRHYDDLLQPSL